MGNPDTDVDDVWDGFEVSNGTKPLKYSMDEAMGDANADGLQDRYMDIENGINVPPLRLIFFEIVLGRQHRPFYFNYGLKLNEFTHLA
jgi:hypothetical protein